MDIFMVSIALIVVGFGLFFVEITVPGLGLPGIIGIISIICGLFLGLVCIKYFWIVLVIVLVLLAIIIKRFKFPKKLVLQNQNKKVEEKDLSYLIGKKGVVFSVLKPLGTCVFDDEYYECYSKQGVIDKDTEIIVKEIKENKIIVVKNVE